MEESKQYNLKKQIKRFIGAKIIDEYPKKITAWSINEINVNQTSKLEIRVIKLDQKITRSSIEQKWWSRWPKAKEL